MFKGYHLRKLSLCKTTKNLTKNIKYHSKIPKTFKLPTSLFVAGSILGFIGSYNILKLEDSEELKGELTYEELYDYKQVLSQKTMLELVKNLIVYQLCCYPILMEIAPSILSILDKIGLESVALWFIKNTMFQHFCGGEDSKEIDVLMHNLRDLNIGTILDYAVEADLEPDSCDLKRKKLNELINKNADYVAEHYQDAIDAASLMPDNFVAVKLTGLLSTKLLEKVNSIQYYLRNSFILQDTKNQNIITRSQMENILKELPGVAEDAQSRRLISKILDKADPNNENSIDWVNYCTALSVIKKEICNLFQGDVSVEVLNNGKTQWKVKFLNEEEVQDLDKLFQRMTDICDKAREKKVKLMIDAEQSYFQAGIDTIASELSAKYNRSFEPLLFNTYQLYLKEGYEKMVNDLIRAKRENISFGAKLVRGAYIVSERKRARQLGLPDIIQDTIEDTHKDYNASVKLLLNEIVHHKEIPKLMNSVQFMVASHNKESIYYTCQEMKKLGIDECDKSKKNVMFGQLLGMQDQSTMTLGKYGFQSYKYVPYGPIREVLPYLIRRAQENSSMIGGIKIERKIVLDEIRTRLFGARRNISVPVEEN